MRMPIALLAVLVTVLAACTPDAERSSPSPDEASAGDTPHEAQEDEPGGAAAAQGGPGRVLYLTYCESCHGLEGRGDGRVAGSLRTPPADLTRLYERYGTPLDRERLADYIDGRRLLGAHGREMPIWGREFFEEVPETTAGLEDLRRRLMNVLADYVETLQAERAL